MAELLLGFVSHPPIRFWNLLFQRTWLTKTLATIVCCSFFCLSNAHALSSKQNLDHFTSGSQLPEQQKDLLSVIGECPPGLPTILAPFVLCHSISDLDEETLAKLEELTNNSELSNIQMLKNYLEVLQGVPDISMMIILSDQAEDHHLRLFAPATTLEVEVIGGVGTLIKCFGYACVIIGELLS